MRAVRVILAGAIVLAMLGTLGATSATAGDRDQLAGVRWESMGGPPGAGRVMQLVQATDPVHVLYAVTENGVHRSTDQGKRWQPVSGLERIPVHSVAPRGTDLIVCGLGVHAVGDGGLRQLHSDGCDAVGTDADTIVFAHGSDSTKQVVVKRLDGTGVWQDVSPHVEDLDDLELPAAETFAGVTAGPIVPVGDHILAGFRVWIDASSEQENGGLYRWDDDDGTWSRVELPAPDGVVLQRLIVDPEAPRRVIATFRDPLLQERHHPISQLAFVSPDSGMTWSPVTDATVESNGVTDVFRLGRTQYLLNPYDGFMLRVKGSRWKLLPMPAVKGIPGDQVGLEAILIDPNDPSVAYGMPGSAWELGLVRSRDRMKSWHKMDRTIANSSPTIVVSQPDDPEVVLTSGNVIQESYATRDGGKTWSLFSPTTSGDELRIDPHDTSHLLLVDEMTNVFESVDGGRTFELAAGQFSGAKILDIEVAPDDARQVYVSNLGVGISRLGVDGAQHMSNSPDYAYDIEIDPDDSDVIYATNSPKKFESHSSVWRYDPEQAADFGWSEILRVEDSGGITSLRFRSLRLRHSLRGSDRFQGQHLGQPGPR